jgi:uncharacterized membrane protein YebE (DUF533 family)
MIGFFEHQLLSYKKNHIKNLLALAKSDGFVHEKEPAVIQKIGKRYGLKERQVTELITSDEVFAVNVPNNVHDKINLLYDLIMVVLADGVIKKNEIDFCEDVVKKFGMKKEIVKWMIEEVFNHGIPPIAEVWAELREEAKEKFIKT